MDERIVFGTSGWRGVIADDFTFKNLRKVSRAIARYLMENNLSEDGIVVGYDTRFLSKEFAKEVSVIFASNGIKVYFFNEPTPTPVVSFSVIRLKSGGGVNITASHNPFYYSGLKYSPKWGGPAEPEITKVIEKYIPLESSEKAKHDFDYFLKNKIINIIDTYKEYLENLLKILPYQFNLSNRIVFDLMYGTGIRYIKGLFKDKEKAILIHDSFDPLFGGLEPVPYEEFLNELKEKVLEKKAIAGFALDGDADRFGVISSEGTFITPNEVLSILTYNFIEGKKEGVGRTISTTRLIDKICDHYKIKVYETPVGFKYIGMLIRDNKIFIGGEESGGLSIKGWLPEKDGILANLLLLQVIEKEKASPKELIENIYEKFGRFYTKRIDLKFSDVERKFIKDFIDNFSSDEIFSLKIKNIDKKDGLLINLEKEPSYILFRISGTENVIRVYFETQDKKLFMHIEKNLNNFIKNIKR